MIFIEAIIFEPLHPALPGGVAGFNAVINGFNVRYGQRFALGHEQRHHFPAALLQGNLRFDLFVIGTGDNNVFAGVQHRHQIADMINAALEGV